MSLVSGAVVGVTVVGGAVVGGTVVVGAGAVVDVVVVARRDHLGRRRPWTHPGATGPRP